MDIKQDVTLELKTITQGGGHVTIAQGETPVICAEEYSSAHTCMAVNFLRSGCPIVQLLLYEVHRHGETLDSVYILLERLQLEGEKFTTKVVKDEEESGALLSVVIITRISKGNPNEN
jgi:hypothetical protein